VLGKRLFADAWLVGGDAGGAIVWIGLAVMTVCGFFVYLQYPNNTLSDGAYAGFLCGIAMVASRFGSILRYMHRQGGS
jgi:hypothetical protein